METPDHPSIRFFSKNGLTKRMLPATDEFEITPAALDALLQAPDAPAFRLIDCREEDEFSLCRIEGAELYPLSRFADAPAGLLAADDDRALIVYCHHGMRSMNATLFLRNRGKEKVWSLAGGIDLWSKTIDPTVPRY
jgi:adenylyltransferase/sulfurtransferase